MVHTLIFGPKTHNDQLYINISIYCNSLFIFSIGKSQPDNREELQNGAKESCLGLLNNFYGDGIHWHDVACHHRKPFICEDSDELLTYVRHNNQNLFIK